MAEVRALCEALEARPGVLDVSFNHGFPYGNNPCVCASATAAADTPEAARACAGELADFVWARRDQFFRPALSAGDGVRRAMAASGSLIVINEISDNPGGGAPGDGTHLLRAALEAGLPSACFASIVDPETVSLAVEAGPGARIDCEIGGKLDPLSGAPIKVSGARVVTLSDGEVRIKSAMMRGYPTHFGRSARLNIEGMDIIVCGIPNQIMDDALFSLHGIDIREYRYVCLKSAQHFKNYFAPLADQIISVDPPGIMTSDFGALNLSGVPRPIFPLDPM